MEPLTLEQLDERLRTIRFLPRPALETRILHRARALLRDRAFPFRPVAQWLVLLSALAALTAFLYFVWAPLVLPGM